MNENIKNHNLIPNNKNSNILPTGIPNLEYIIQLIDTVKNSPLAKPFTTRDGKVDESAIMTNMILGHEMGLAPMASLALGKKIDKDSYLSVMRGRELGIDPSVSMTKIYHIPTKNGPVMSLGKDIVEGLILSSGTEIHFIRKYQPAKMYTTLDGIYMGHEYMLDNFDDNYIILDKDNSNKDDVLIAVKEENKIALVKKSGITFVSSVRLVRKSNNIDETFHYSIQEAINAKLHIGYHSSNKDIDGKTPLYIPGKDNWNLHPATHLTDRVLLIAGRVVVADKLAGSYSIDETVDILNTENNTNMNTLP